VIHETCPACGFDGAAYDDAALLEALRALGPRWRSSLADAGAELRIRPAPEVWSAIEYAAHSRDIIALHGFGVEQALTGAEPVFPAIEADEMIERAAAAYASEEPGAVLDALDAAGRRLADLAATAPPSSWAFGITIGDERSSVRRLLEHALHDSSHHVGDVERGLRSLRA
jgi:S-DNA-T family DNA segregation ATPase FtsK/SpoIIIE